MNYSAIPMHSRTQKSSEIYIDRFLGCDFRTGGLLDDIRRSPDAVNMDFGEELHTPVKRAGYTNAINRTLDAPINGLHKLKKYDAEHRLIHAGTKLYLLSEGNVPTQIYSGMANAASSSFVMNNTLFILDGKEYLVFDGTTASKATDLAYVPTTAISNNPNEQPNKLTAKRKNIFYASNEKYLFLDSANIDSAQVIAYVKGTQIAEGSQLSVERTLGVIAFNISIETNAEIVVHFSKTTSGSTASINKCRNVIFEKNDTKALLSGNPDTLQTSYQSAPFNPLYFPEDAQVYTESDTSPYTTCIAPRSICALGDEPLFLSRHGICAVTPSLYNSYYYIQNRSVFVNNMLVNEGKLESAFSVVMNNKLYLFINDCVYVADGRLRQKSGHDGIQYEWHRWTNIPATAAVEWGERLFFGTKDGNVYRFMTAEDDGDDIYHDLDKPVTAYWTTPFLGTPVTGGGNWGRKKSIPRAAVVLKPFLHCGADIYSIKESEGYHLIKSVSVSMMDFSSADFADLTFHCVNRPRTITMKNVARRFEYMQLLIKSDRPEGLGLTAIQIQMTSGAEVKGE